MTGLSSQQKATVGLIKLRSEALTEPESVEVLNHLLSVMTQETLHALSPEAQAQRLDALSTTPSAAEAIKMGVDLLPQAGRVAVLDHLLSVMTKETLSALSPEARAQLLKLLPDESSFAARLSEFPVGTPVTPDESSLLMLHRSCRWGQDKEAESHARGVGPITPEEAVLLKVYRTNGVRDTEGIVGIQFLTVCEGEDVVLECHVTGTETVEDSPQYAALIVDKRSLGKQFS